MTDKFEPLFKSDSDWHNNACLNFSHKTAYGYVSGYKCAADSLVIQVNETGRNQDKLVFPIVFLYRHYLELLLKFIIDVGRQLENKNGYPTHHRIENLWPEAKGIIRKMWPGGDPEEMKLTDHVIKELSSVDPESMCFRYPESKDGEKYIPDITHINLRHLGQTIDTVGTFLEGVLMGIGNHLDNEYE